MCQSILKALKWTFIELRKKIQSLCHCSYYLALITLSNLLYASGCTQLSLASGSGRNHAFCCYRAFPQAFPLPPTLGMLGTLISSEMFRCISPGQPVSRSQVTLCYLPSLAPFLLSIEHVSICNYKCIYFLL